MIPLYCNPFSPRCKQNFCHFGNFFERKQENRPYFAGQGPESAKNRTKQPPESGFPPETAQSHAEKIGDADVCGAESEMQKKPAVKGCKHKKKVRTARVTGAQGTQETIDCPQCRTGQAGIEETRSRKERCRHRISRLNQPPTGRGSS